MRSTPLLSDVSDSRISSARPSGRLHVWMLAGLLAGAIALPVMADDGASADGRFERAMETFSRRVAEPSECREIRSPESDGLAALGTSNCCETPGHGGPGCDDSACSDFICFELDSFCCVTWDDTCVDIAIEVCGVCGGSLCGGSTENCCTGNPNKPPKCEDEDCCAVVCALDPPCCAFNWDAQCRNEANAVCSVCTNGLGDCCTAHDGVSCANTACAAAVCSVDPFCCGEGMGTWDEFCVAAALEECPASACPRALSVTKSGTGTGSILGPGISCPSDCAETYDYGTAISLSANPTGGSIFTGWTGDCTGTGACELTMTANRAVTGTINPGAQTLTVSVAGLGAGTVTGTGIACPGDCTESYSYGTMVSLTATPDGSDVFAGWSGACTGASTCNVTMTQARSVTATFNPPNQSLTVTKSGTGTGSITATGIACPGDCTQDYAYGSLVNLTATPTAGSVFVGWSGDCAGTGACQVTMDQARAVTGTFDPPPPQTLTVVVTGAGSGSVTDDATSGTAIDCPGDCTESYAYATVVDLTASPDAGSLFDGWSNDCVAAGTDTACQLTLTAARTATATFVVDPDIFSDGFENGDLCAWSSQSGGPACGP